MEFRKKTLVASIALAAGSLAVAQPASANLIFTFENNTTATQPGATQLGFPAGDEFHFVTPYGSQANAGSQDIIHGGEQWIFNGETTGAQMSAVANTDTNSGQSGTSGQAPLTAGVAGYPIASTPGTVDTLHQNFAFFGGYNFTFQAPLTGNVVGQTFGAAHLGAGTTNNFTQAGAFTVTMPVVHMQWADGSLLLGGDDDGNAAHGVLQCASGGPCPGPGVVFNGNTDGAGNFTLWASRTLSLDEVTLAGFDLNTAEWSLQGSYATSAVPLPAAAWLFGSGLAGLVAVARRRRRRE